MRTLLIGDWSGDLQALSTALAMLSRHVDSEEHVAFAVEGELVNAVRFAMTSQQVANQPNELPWCQL